MPLVLENKLKREARQHGFKKGSDRYNRYVYGTMNKLGLFSHNHAGNLGPDKLLRKTSLDYEPSFNNVHGIHIAVVVAIIFLLVWHFFGGNIGSVFRYSGVNGDGATTYNDVQSWKGWINYQYNSLGAMAGAQNGESN